MQGSITVRETERSYREAVTKRSPGLPRFAATLEKESALVMASGEEIKQI